MELIVCAFVFSYNQKDCTFVVYYSRYSTIQDQNNSHGDS